MRWKIAEAKQRFSEVLRSATKTPQLIFKRDTLVAAVVDAATFERFQAWRQDQRRRSVAEAFRQLREICAEESYVLESTARADRKNVFPDAIDELPR